MIDPIIFVVAGLTIVGVAAFIVINNKNKSKSKPKSPVVKPPVVVEPPPVTYTDRELVDKFIKEQVQPLMTEEVPLYSYTFEDIGSGLLKVTVLIAMRPGVSVPFSALEIDIKEATKLGVYARIDQVIVKGITLNA